ncbi:MAG: DsbA family protein, partial [Bifidobacteriaceae bacterium]|nr:DsbA family protein [Bifidobacteriaceae bacterium]
MENKTYKLLVAAIITGVLAAVVVIVVLVSLNSSTPQNSTNSANSQADSREKGQYFTSDVNKVWNENMVLGNFANAQNHFVEYADPMCGYCAKFSLALIHNKSTFHQNYLDNGKLSLEVRLTDLLQSDDKRDNSKRAAEYAYCAADQNRFEDYYDAFIEELDKDYFSKGIGSYHGAPEIEKLPDSYYDNVAKNANLDTGELSDCLKSGKGGSQLRMATASASKIINGGLPNFWFNNFKTGGFEGGWENVLKMFAAGGVS